MTLFSCPTGDVTCLALAHISLPYGCLLRLTSALRFCEFASRNLRRRVGLSFDELRHKIQIPLPPAVFRPLVHRLDEPLEAEHQCREIERFTLRSFVFSR